MFVRILILACVVVQATEAKLHSKEQDLQTVEADLQKAQQELLGKERQLSNLAADLNGGEPCEEFSDYHPGLQHDPVRGMYLLQDNGPLRCNCAAHVMQWTHA